MKIAITKNSPNEEKFSKYKSWLLRYNPGVEFRELTYENPDTTALETCDGLLLTGGDDLDPKFYGMEGERQRTKGAEEKRDEFEFEMIRKAFERKMPILGICRGLQSMNVFTGGSLHIDLESDGFAKHSESEGKENRHALTVEPTSKLHRLVGQTSGEVNSSHHQAAHRPGKELAIAARSGDGVVEAMEWQEEKGKPFLLLVQWHPERMKDASNPLAERIARAFLEEVITFRKK